MEVDQLSPRQRAWITRRQKYGQHGHAGSYIRDRYASPHDLFSCVQVPLAESRPLLPRLRGMLSQLQSEIDEMEHLICEKKSQMEIVSETVDLLTETPGEPEV